MSFLKNLFGNKKDKYGKGHRLGDPSTPRYEPPAPQPNRPHTANTERPSQQTSDASRAAGQAALARMQQIQQPSKICNLIKINFYFKKI